MKMKINELKTERLILKSISDEDRTGVLRILMNDVVKKTYMIPDFENEELAAPLFNRLKELSDSDEHFVRGIFLDSELIGFLNDVDISGETIELGYVIYPAYWNKGYMSEALYASINELFKIGYNRVQAGYFAENEASHRVMLKSGMRDIDKTDEIEYRGIVHTCKYCEKRK